MKLTESEKLAITKGETICTTEDGIRIIIVRADVYDQFRSALDPEVVTALSDETMTDHDAADPLLESYQKLRP